MNTIAKGVRAFLSVVVLIVMTVWPQWSNAARDDGPSATPPPQGEGQPGGSQQLGTCKPQMETILDGSGPQFEMVVLGDSVMWGQGHREDTKLSTLIQGWVRATYKDRPVRKRVYAHSGATLSPDPDKPEPRRLHGEVPYSYLSVIDQMDCVENPEKVDLVLIDGCINDVNMIRILNPAGTAGDLRIVEHCSLAMRKTLGMVAAQFPNARIIVTGYFPPISSRSDPIEIASLVSMLLGPVGGAVVTAAMLPHIVDMSSHWYSSSTQALDQAVKDLNEKTRSSNFPSGRIAFASIQFSDENAFAAPKSYLWPFPIPPDQDPVFAPRTKECAKAGFLIDKCYLASAAHPNIEGAQVYAEAIRSAFGRIPKVIKPELRVASIKPNPIPVCTKSPVDVTVEVVEAKSGQPIGNATVYIDGKAVGRAGKAFPYTFRMKRYRWGTVSPNIVIQPDDPRYEPVGPTGRVFDIPTLTLSYRADPDPYSRPDTPTTSVVTIFAEDTRTKVSLQNLAVIGTEEPPQVGVTGTPFKREFIYIPGPTGVPKGTAAPQVRKRARLDDQDNPQGENNPDQGQPSEPVADPRTGPFYNLWVVSDCHQAAWVDKAIRIPGPAAPLPVAGTTGVDSKKTGQADDFTFNVPVKLSNLDPRVKELSVFCEVFKQDKPVEFPGFALSWGHSFDHVREDGSYSGTVVVKVNVASPSSPSAAKSWLCRLRLGDGKNWAWVNTAPWARAQSGSVLRVQGTFPQSDFSSTTTRPQDPVVKPAPAKELGPRPGGAGQKTPDVGVGNPKIRKPQR